MTRSENMREKKTVIWHCNKCGHEWKQRGVGRSRDYCPVIGCWSRDIVKIRDDRDITHEHLRSDIQKLREDSSKLEQPTKKDEDWDKLSVKEKTDRLLRETGWQE